MKIDSTGLNPFCGFFQRRVSQYGIVWAAELILYPFFQQKGLAAEGFELGSPG